MLSVGCQVNAKQSPRSGHNLALYDGDQRGAWSIRNDLGINFAAKVALIHLDLSAEHGFALSLQLVGNNLAQMQEIVRGGVTVNPTKPRRRSRRGSSYEMLNQTTLFVLT
jgi:hypothetical protein